MGKLLSLVIIRRKLDRSCSLLKELVLNLLVNIVVYSCNSTSTEQFGESRYRFKDDTLQLDCAEWRKHTYGRIS